MTRTPLAAALAALFVLSTSAAAQTAGTGTAPTPAPGAMTSGTTAPAPRATANTPRGDTKPASTLDRGDRKFIDNAALDGMKEVEVGRVVSGKASDPGVKAFADRMVKDHGDANKKLMDIAQSKGVTPPTDLRRSDRREIDKMAKMDPAKLDQAYMKEMVKDHKKDVKAFEKEAKNGKDADVKRFASETLPVLQDHLKMAEDTQSKLKGAGSAATRRLPAANGSNTAGATVSK